MISSKILAQGKFSPSDLVILNSESNRQIDPTIENQIDPIWNAMKKAADAEGRICYNGTGYRLNSLERKDNKLFIDFGTIEFKTVAGLMKIPEYFDLDEKYYRKNCFCDATVKTSDNRYLMVELSGKSMNKNSTDLLGGMIEEPMKMRTGIDVFESLYVELKEEGCILKSDIGDAYLKAIYLSTKTNIGFYFEVTLNITANELQKRFETENKDPDIKSLIDFSRDEYLDHLKNHKSSNNNLVSEIVQI